MFSPHQMDLLQALVNQIIPADQDAGGWDAGVGDYLLGQFERDLIRFLPVYRVGLDRLDAEAEVIHQMSFDRLSASQQENILSDIERGVTTTDWMIDPAAFLLMAAEHCAEGYYSDPANGGNKDGVAWKMIGFEVRG